MSIEKACAIIIKERSSTKQSQISPLKNESYQKNKNVCFVRYGHSAKSLIEVVWMAHQKLGMDTDLQTLPIPLLQFHPKQSHLVTIWFKWYQRDYASSHLAILWRRSKDLLEKKPTGETTVLSTAVWFTQWVTTGSTTAVFTRRRRNKGHCEHQSVVGEQFEQRKQVRNRSCGRGKVWLTVCAVCAVPWCRVVPVVVVGQVGRGP